MFYSPNFQGSSCEDSLTAWLNIWRNDSKVIVNYIYYYSLLFLIINGFMN